MIASIRATIQLLIVGYILKIVFGFDNPFAVILMVFVMIFVAAKNAAKRGKGLPNLFGKIFITITIVEVITQGFLLSFRIIPPEPSYIISISGMIIGNSMVIASLFLNRLKGEVGVEKRGNPTCLVFRRNG